MEWLKDRSSKLWRAMRAGLRLFLGLVLGGTLVLLVAIIAGRSLDAEPGSIAEWLAAVSALAALLAASYAAVQTSRTFRIEQGRDRQRDQAIRQRQAELVAVWAGLIMHRGPRITVSGVGNETQEPGVVCPESIPVTIRNASDLPIFGLTVDVYIGDPNQEEVVLGGRYKVLDDQNGTAVLGTLKDVEVVNPEMVESMSRAIALRPGSTSGPSPISIGWSFKDNAGVLWCKQPGRVLEEQAR